MFALVFFTGPMVSTFVPEKFVFGLSEEKLKNYGTNSGQSHLIFWSKKALRDGDVPDLNYAPNFFLPTSDIFPPIEDEICYIGKVKRFFGKCNERKLFMHFDLCIISKFCFNLLISQHCACIASFDDAKGYQAKFRQVEPQLYNPRRFYERPIPQLVPMPPNNNDVEPANDVLSGSDDEIDAPQVDENLKNVLSEVILDVDDFLAFGSYFDDEERDEEHVDSDESSVDASENLVEQSKNDGEEPVLTNGNTSIGISYCVFVLFII